VNRCGRTDAVGSGPFENGRGAAARLASLVFLLSATFCGLAAFPTADSWTGSGNPDFQTSVPLADGSPWDRVAAGAYENNGIAWLEKLDSRWALSVKCGTTHTVYLDDTSIDLTRYTPGYVNARYRYVDRTVADPRCFRSPCPASSERRIALERLQRVTLTPQEVLDAENRCADQRGKNQ
jgi:hypothetical protein